MISSKLQTKEWRKQQKWYKGGKKSECEIFQCKLLTEKGYKLQKTSKRIHIFKNQIQNKATFQKDEDGYCWTETFDRICVQNGETFYFNLKFVCGSGGAQTRSLRETFHFICSQVQYLNTNLEENIIFVNILEGDESFKNMQKLKYARKKLKKECKGKLFIGDLQTFLNNDN